MHQEYAIKFEDSILKINASHFTSWELQKLIKGQILNPNAIIWATARPCRGQREFSIPGILDVSQLHFFLLDHEKWLFKVSISSRNMREAICYLIISISSRQVRARKIILNLVSKNCTFSREWEWDYNPITGRYTVHKETIWCDFW